MSSTTFGYDACIEAVREIERVAPGRGYIQVDAYRSEDERDVFLDWVLTADTFGTPEMWRELFGRAGYTGDYYWTILEADPEWTVRNASGDRDHPGVDDEEVCWCSAAADRSASTLRNICSTMPIPRR